MKKTYTMKNTINDIASDEFLVKRMFSMITKDIIDMVPEELRDSELGILREKLRMPWGVPYLSDALVDIANLIYDICYEDKYETVRLWSDKVEQNYFPMCDNDENFVSLIRFKDSFKEERPMALIVPGGAYQEIAMPNEGMEIAKELAGKGYAVSILMYRVRPNRYPLPQTDLAMAVKYLRSHASEFGVKNQIMTVGFSAGGHLVASEACYSDKINQEVMKKLENQQSDLYDRYKDISVKPEQVCMAYPVINCQSDNHEDSYINLTGGGDSMRQEMSIDCNVTSDFPKAFVWACDDDGLVPSSNAKRMYEKLQNVGVESELHIYPTGDHGIGVGIGTSAEGWIDSLVRFMKGIQ